MIGVSSTVVVAVIEVLGDLHTAAKWFDLPHFLQVFCQAGHDDRPLGWGCWPHPAQLFGFDGSVGAIFLISRRYVGWFVIEAISLGGRRCVEALSVDSSASSRVVTRSSVFKTSISDKTLLWWDGFFSPAMSCDFTMSSEYDITHKSRSQEPLLLKAHNIA